ncbi:MAG: 1-(5-phosphoribosyl)-5-[(5-phosphoribosylamino)methylideneamino] imidazole-4-carboxamide isomerase [Phycisphaerae bacterium]|nr:1-(5-phosphoribosyl)-5-[(5-phosphoribosylamino)methylideneamino] imidazole-4-carboxamide isomerase [Phycisphaerae bacterium]
MDILPAIDLRDRKVVRLLQGDYGRQIDYADDPLAVARDFESRGARWLHVVDLDAARTGEPTNYDVIAGLCSGTGLAVEVGGGVRSEATIARLLDMGVTRVVIGTRALREWDWFAGLFAEPRFAGRVVLGLDARAGRLAADGWTQSTGESAVEVARRSGPLPLAGIVYTDIATDGMMTGPNLAAVREMVAASPHPVIASGGVGSADHIRALARTGAAAAIVGRALYEGAVTIESALAAASG